MFRQYLVASLALLLLVATHAGAQSEAAPQEPAAQSSLTEKAREKQQEIQRSALALLNEVAAEAQTLRLAENRIRIQVIAADLLWPRDESRARAAFKEAASNLNQLAGNIVDADNPQSYNYGHLAFTLRHEMLQMVARRDARLALEMLRATRQPESQAASGHRPHENERYMEQSLAAQVAASDPKLALQVAEESLSKGLSLELINVFSRLQEKDSEAAAKLLTSIVGKIRSENLSTNHEAANVAFNLLQSISRQPAPNSPSAPNQPAVKTTTIDQQIIRDLMDTVAVAALNAPPNNPHLLSMLQGMIPQIEKYASARVPSLRRKIAEMHRGQDEPNRQWNEFNSLIQNGTLEAVIEAAAKAPPEARSGFYQQAAWKALGQNDPGQARQLINDHISDPMQRNQMLAHIDRDAAWRELNQGKLAEARQLLARLRSTEERIGLLAQMAAMIQGKGDHQLARGLLEEARGLLDNQVKNTQQLNTRLQVARAYASLEPAQSFELIEPIIDRINEVLAATEVLDGFMGGNAMFRDGELIMQPQNGQLEMIYYSYAREIGQLARHDFKRAKDVADRFQRTEARIMALLLVAQGVLGEQTNAEQGMRNQGRRYGGVGLGSLPRPIMR
ncbi:MAG: hypothetical protein H0T92_03040 [Pyrinomonadaceae bacterium]|nr:hypothetical protein [Pyrinomonadaceae bacterium]